MIIKLKDKHSKEKIEIDHNQNNRIMSFSGNSYLVDTLKRELSKSYGLYGHILNIEHPDELDLYSACLSLENFKLVSCEPMPQPPEPLPEGAIP